MRDKMLKKELEAVCGRICMLRRLVNQYKEQQESKGEPIDEDYIKALQLRSMILDDRQYVLMDMLGKFNDINQCRKEIQC